MPRKQRKNQQVKETPQDLNTKTEAINKTQTEEIMEMENLDQ